MRLRTATLGDVPALADVTRHAFNDDPLFDELHPHRKQYPDDFRRFFELRYRENLLSPDYLVAVVVTEPSDVPIDTTLRYDGKPWSNKGGDLVGAAVWRRTGSNGELVVVNDGGFLMGLYPLPYRVTSTNGNDQPSNVL
jgi:hypothetical protein